MKNPQPVPVLEQSPIAYPGTSNNVEVDFSEYMWMGEELDEFDRQVEEELWEEAFIEACFEEMMAEENGTSSQLNNNNNSCPPPPQSTAVNQHQQYVHRNNMANIEDSMKLFTIRETVPVKEEVVRNSSLNPDAPEFVPGNYMKR